MVLFLNVYWWCFCYSTCFLTFYAEIIVLRVEVPKRYLFSYVCFPIFSDYLIEKTNQRSVNYTLREKCPNTEFFLVRIFLYWHWIQENTPYLDPFHAVNRTSILTSILTSSVDLSMKHKQDLALNLMSRGHSCQKLRFIFYPSISPLMFHINHTDFFLSSRQCMCPKIFKTHLLSFWPSYATIVIVSLQSLQQPCCK